MSTTAMKYSYRHGFLMSTTCQHNCMSMTALNWGDIPGSHVLQVGVCVCVGVCGGGE